MICPKCQYDNPDTNRFCGNCGAALIQKPASNIDAADLTSKSEHAPDEATSHYEPEAYDEPEAPRLSPEVIEFDKKIPLIAEPGSDRRSHVPKHIMDEVHDFLDDIHGSEARPARTDDTAYEDQLRTERSARANAQAQTETGARGSETRRGNYLDLEDSREAEEQNSDRVSGPSFLGLGNSDYEYVYDDQRPSHWRRNFALLVLVVLAVLAAVQWRSIRDMGLEYAKSGTIKMKVPKPGGHGQADANTNGNQSAATNNNGAPNMSVDPTRNADAENAKLHAEEEAAKGQQSAAQQNTAQPQNSSAENNNSGNNASSATPPAMPPAETATTDNVNNTREGGNDAATKATPSNTNASRADAQPATRNGSNAPAAMGAPAGSGRSTASAEEASPPPTRAAAEPAPKRTSARVPKPTPTPAAPGAFEMRQANILGQTSAAVPWLWSALGKGNPDAPVKLADMYVTGRGVEKSCDQGLVILRSAAARGNARASARLGTLYATGICVQQNRVQAYEWMGTAAGRSQSLSSWADAYRQTLWQQMTPEERARVR
ncbi:MAG TPA: zinc-ribbon domain-containing protein [Terriglobales bacterium]